MRKGLGFVLIVLVSVSATIGVGARGQASAPAPASTGVEAVQVRPNIYMFAGGGGNVVAQIGTDGVIVVDAGDAASADGIVAAIRRVTDKPIRYIVNTNADPDHVGGNVTLSRAGRTIFNVGNALGAALTNSGAAGIIAYETVLFRMSGRGSAAPPFPANAWPTDTHAQPRRALYLNDEAVEFLYQAAAHSDGDMAVFFRGSDVIAAGDVIDTRRFPAIDVDRGGTIDGEVAALNRLVDLAVPQIPFVWKTGGTYIVPGHGRVYTQPDVVNYRDMVVIVRDRVRDLIRQGRTLAQIQGASPTQGYTRAFGGDSSASAFVEAVYRTSQGGRR